MDLADPRVGYNTLLEVDGVPTANILTDVWTGEVFVIRNNSVYWLNLADSTPNHKVFKWRSKKFQSPVAKNFAVMKIYFSVPGTTPTQAVARTTDLVQTLDTDQYGLVRVYADDVLVTTRELRTSGELMRIVSDRRADFWHFEFEARVEIHSFAVATSAKELALV